jgi:hypothetical protein
MKPSVIIIRAPLEFLDEAVAVMKKQAERYDDYDRIGYGWSFGGGMGRRPRFFVRRIKHGLSCTTTVCETTMTVTYSPPTERF